MKKVEQFFSSCSSTSILGLLAKMKIAQLGTQTLLHAPVNIRDVLFMLQLGFWQTAKWIYKRITVFHCVYIQSSMGAVYRNEDNYDITTFLIFKKVIH